MKRMHVHVGVENLGQGINFYNALFGVPPIKTRADYAKWMLGDPRLNFAISTRSGKTGVDHLGFQVDEDHELQAMRDRLERADMSSLEHEGETVCCYARSDKSWVEDPSGVAWEVYETMQDAEFFSSTGATDNESACCAPETKGQPDCCEPSAKTVGCCG